MILHRTAASILALTIASAAHAQEVPAPPSSDTSPVPAGQDVDPGKPTGDIIVTGSRIARKDYTAESPIVTVGAEAVAKTGTAALEDTLNRLPQFAGSSTGQSAASSQRGGRSNLNLRGLGIARTLVLLDGRRLQPSDPLGAIDLNTISPSLIENVEVISGGASAIYGSDAIAGVVNFKLKQRFEGVQLDALAGISERGDAGNRSLSVTAGHNLGGRGNITLLATYFARDGVLREARPFFDDIVGTSVPASGTYTPDATNLPTQAAVNALFTGTYGFPTAINRNGLYSQNPDGTIYEQRSGANFRPGYPLYYRASTGAVFVRPSPQTLQQPLTRYTFFGKADYEVADRVTAYAQASYTDYNTSQVSNGVLQATSVPVFVSIANSAIPADLRRILASRPRPNDSFLYYSTTARFGPSGARQDYTVQQYVGGLRGDVGIRDWTFDVNGSFGRTREVENQFGLLDKTAFQAVLSAADAGASLCAGGYQIFTYAPISQECRTYLQRKVENRFTFTQYTADANFQGGLFDNWAGEIRYAAGASYRRNEYNAVPDLQLSQVTVIGSGGVDPSAGKTSVYEGYVEALVPLIRNVPLIRSLDLDLAYRRSQYDTIGGVDTYKASAEWEMAQFLKLRGGYQRAIRAPSVGELFQARRFVAANIGSIATGGGDPCNIVTSYRTGPNAANVRALCLATGVPAGLIDSYNFIGTAVLAAQVGNRDLTQETANSYTGGLVLTPKFDFAPLRRFSFSVDYFDIAIKDAIGSISTAVSLQRCFNGDGGSNPTYSATNYFCALIQRDGLGTPSRSLEPTANLASYSTTGFDMQLDWRLAADDVGLNPSLGAFSINAVVSRTLSYKIQNLASSPVLDYVGTIGNGQIDAESISHPKWKSISTFTYDNGPASISLVWRYIDGMANSLNVGATNPTAKGIGSANYFDLSTKVDIGTRGSLRLGVVNLFDKAPPTFTGQGATDPSTYDLVQRRFFVSMTARY